MRYEYSCSTCGSSVLKKATGMNGEQYTGLHGWKCSGKCGASVKVNRKLKEGK